MKSGPKPRTGYRLTPSGEGLLSGIADPDRAAAFREVVAEFVAAACLCKHHGIDLFAPKPRLQEPEES